jgi:hypothetical protein
MLSTLLKKEQVLLCIQTMPQRFTIDDLLEKLFLLAKVHKGLDQISKGNTYSQDEIEKMAKGWFNDNALTK